MVKVIRNAEEISMRKIEILFAMHFHNRFFQNVLTECKLQTNGYYAISLIFFLKWTIWFKISKACGLINELEIVNDITTCQMVCVIHESEIAALQQKCAFRLNLKKKKKVFLILFYCSRIVERHRLCAQTYDNIQRRFDMRTTETSSFW